ncbi:hypothetical protein MUP77_10890, partial [Candidatus Bathyarchaeota archaeon]|nr:hypothetical protein [Candidatus Bathyarchaeota archaeon]
FVYGLLTMPTTVWGSTPGIFKPLLGIAIGLSLDLMTYKLQPQGKVTKPLMAVIFPLVWWSLTGGIWVLAGLPIVQIFQLTLMSIPTLRPVASQGFVATFASIALMTIPSSVVAAHSAVSLSKRVGQIVTIPHFKITKEEVNSGKRAR